MFPSVAVAVSVRLFSFYFLSLSVCAFLKMASLTEKQVKECGGSSPLQVGAERKIAVTGRWLTPGQETTQIRFYGHADRTILHCRFRVSGGWRRVRWVSTVGSFRKGSVVRPSSRLSPYQHFDGNVEASLVSPCRVWCLAYS